MFIPEDTSALGYEGLDQSSKGWLADCFIDAELHCSPDDMYVPLNFTFDFDLLFLSLFFSFFIII